MKAFLLKLKATDEEQNERKTESIKNQYLQILTDGIQEELPPARKGKRGREKKSKGLKLIIRL